MRAWIPAVALVALATSCAKPPPYSPELVTGFMTACIAKRGGTQASEYCSCVLKQIEATIPEADFRRMETGMALGKPPSDEFVDAMTKARSACGS